MSLSIHFAVNRRPVSMYSRMKRFDEGELTTIYFGRLSASKKCAVSGCLHTAGAQAPCVLGRYLYKSWGGCLDRVHGAFSNSRECVKEAPFVRGYICLALVRRPKGKKTLRQRYSYLSNHPKKADGQATRTGDQRRWERGRRSLTPRSPAGRLP